MKKPTKKTKFVTVYVCFHEYTSPHSINELERSKPLAVFASLDRAENWCELRDWAGYAELQMVLP